MQRSLMLHKTKRRPEGRRLNSSELDTYFLRRINFTARIATPPIASSGKTSGSGTTAAQAAAGSINKSAVISFCDFIAYSFICPWP